MTILDRYILKSFFFNLTLWFVCFIGMFVVFDFATNYESILQIAKQDKYPIRVVGLYYLFQSIPWMMMLSSLLSLLSAMVTVALMMRHNEIVPIQAAGITTIRIVMPLILGFFSVSCFFAVVRECVVPHYLSEMVALPADFISEQGKVVNATTDYEYDMLLSGQSAFMKAQKITQPSVTIRPPIVPKTITIKATEALFQPATAERPAGYLFAGEVVTTPAEILNGPTVAYQGKPIFITHQTAPEWMETGQLFVVTKIPFEYIACNTSWRQNASTWSMIQAIRNTSLDIDSHIEGLVHARILQPILDMVLLFLGLPLMLSSGDRNVFKSLGIASLLVVTFFIIRETCLSLGGSSEMPVLGAWLPLLIFGPVAAAQFQSLREK